jgi:hypothetical protein
MENHDQ